MSTVGNHSPKSFSVQCVRQLARPLWRADGDPETRIKHGSVVCSRLVRVGGALGREVVEVVKRIGGGGSQAFKRNRGDKGFARPRCSEQRGSGRRLDGRVWEGRQSYNSGEGRSTRQLLTCRGGMTVVFWLSRDVKLSNCGRFA